MVVVVALWLMRRLRVARGLRRVAERDIKYGLSRGMMVKLRWSVLVEKEGDDVVGDGFWRGKGRGGLFVAWATRWWLEDRGDFRWVDGA